MPWFDAHKRQWTREFVVNVCVHACGCATTKHLDQYRIALSELGKLHVVDWRARKTRRTSWISMGLPEGVAKSSTGLPPVRQDDGRCFRDYVIPEAQTNDRWLRNFWKCAQQERCFASFQIAFGNGISFFENFIDTTRWWGSPSKILCGNLREKNFWKLGLITSTID